MSEDLIEDIREVVRVADLKKIREVLKKINIGKNSSSELRLQVSIGYYYVGDMINALMSLGKERPLNELINATKLDYELYLRRAYLYALVGAIYRAKRLLNNFLEFSKEKSIDLKKIKNSFEYIGVVYEISFDYKNALFYSILNLKYDKNIFIPYISYTLAEIYTNLGNLEEARNHIERGLEVSKELDHQIYIFVCYQTYAQILITWDKLDEAKIYLDLALNHYPKGDDRRNSLDFGRLLLECAIYYFKKNEIDSAKEYISKADDIFCVKISEVALEHCFLFWKEKIVGTLSLEESVFLRCNKNSTPFQFFVGKKITNTNEHYLPEWAYNSFVNKGDFNSDFDCWHVTKGKVTKAKYKEIYPIQKMRYDLVSGIVSDENMDKNLLTENNHKALIVLFGGNIHGTSHWTLYDYVYQNDIFDLDSAKKRVEKVISAIKKMGFSIKSKNNIIKFVIDQSYDYILPMNFESIGINQFISNRFVEFKRSDIESELDLGQRTANRVIEKLVCEGLYQKDGKGKNIKYVKL